MRTSKHRYDFSTAPIIFSVVVACLCCWVSCYFYSVGYPVYGEISATPLWNAICRLFPGKLLTYLLGMLLMAGGAFLLHRANYELALIREKTHLPALFYLLLVSTNVDFFPIKSTSLGVFCLIVAIYQLFMTFHNPEAREEVFISFFLIGLGSLLWVHLLWFVPLFWWGMFLFRTANFRTVMASVVGLITVYWLLLGWCVWQNEYSMFTLPFVSLAKLQFMLPADWSWVSGLSIALIVLLTTVSSVHILAHETDESLRSRQYFYFLIVMAIEVFLLNLLYEQMSEEFLEIACIPASLLMAHFFTLTKGRTVYWIFYGSVLLLVLFLFVRLWSY